MTFNEPFDRMIPMKETERYWRLLKRTSEVHML